MTQVLTPAARMERMEIYAFIKEVTTLVNEHTIHKFEPGQDTHRETYNYHHNPEAGVTVIGMTYIGLFSQYGMEITWEHHSGRLIAQYPQCPVRLTVSASGCYSKLYDKLCELVLWLDNNPHLC